MILYQSNLCFYLHTIHFFTILFNSSAHFLILPRPFPQFAILRIQCFSSRHHNYKRTPILLFSISKIHTNITYTYFLSIILLYTFQIINKFFFHHFTIIVTCIYKKKSTLDNITMIDIAN